MNGQRLAIKQVRSASYRLELVDEGPCGLFRFEVDGKDCTRQRAELQLRESVERVILETCIAGFEGNLGFEPVIRKVTRTLTHGLTHLNLWDFAPQDDSQPVYFPFRDFIPRWHTASAQVIQGVKKGENPSLTIAWTIPGSTLTTVAIPLWITPKGELPKVVTRNNEGHATLVDAGFILKKQLFPIERGNGADYINLSRLINHAGTGILQQIEPVETEIFRKAQSVIKTIRRNNCTGKETTEFYQWIDQYIKEQYQQRFGIVINAF